MCGIAAFSMPAGSKQNARALAHALLSKIESRGHHASGFAYIDANGNFGVYKQPKPGSQLPLHELPRNARTVILHTRYATQGHPNDNRNNHPVLSTDRSVALVHNGVISNDSALRGDLGITREAHGEVDSLVIPTLLAQEGLAGLKKMSGYAAVAWLDLNDTGYLHIARLKSSPAAYTWLYDGTFVMASTQSLLTSALDDIKAFYGGVFDIAEGRKFTITDGFILENEPAPSMSYSHQAWRQHSQATSGGPAKAASGYQQPLNGSTKVGAVGTEVVPATENPPKTVIGTPTDQEAADQVYADLEAWRKRREEDDKRDTATAIKALESLPSKEHAMALGMQEELEDDEWDQRIEAMERAQREVDEAFDSCAVNFAAGEGYYIVDGEGDMSHYPTLDDLESRLKFLSGMTASEYDLFQFGEKEEKDALGWTNHIMDIGSVDEKGELVSWVDDMSDIDEHESPAVQHLNYIREGVGKLLTLKGA